MQAGPTWVGMALHVVGVCLGTGVGVALKGKSEVTAWGSGGPGPCRRQQESPRVEVGLSPGGALQWPWPHAWQHVGWTGGQPGDKWDAGPKSNGGQRREKPVPSRHQEVLGTETGAASMSWSPGSGPAWPHSQAHSTTLHPSSVRPSPAPLPSLCWPLWMSPACDPGTQ